MLPAQPHIYGSISTEIKLQAFIVVITQSTVTGRKKEIEDSDDFLKQSKS